MLSFVAETRIPVLHKSCNDEFTTPSLKDFMDSDREGMIFYLGRAVKHYLSRMEWFCPSCSNFYISSGRKKV